MKLTEQLVERLANLCFGCTGLGLGLAAFPAFGAVGAAAVSGAVGAGTVMGFAAAARQKHGPDSERGLSRIRERLKREWQLDAAMGWAGVADVEAACDALAQDLSKCMLSPRALAEVATESAGRRFPIAATEIVLRALADQNPIFRTDTTTSQFARAVITEAFEAAIEDQGYFSRFEPHLLVELARVAGRTFGIVEEMQAKIDFLPEATAHAVVDLWRKQGTHSSLAPDIIIALARRMPDEGESVDALVRGLVLRLDAAEQLVQQGRHPQNIDEIAGAVLTRVGHLAEAGRFDAAANEAESGLVQMEKEEVERASAMSRARLALLDAAIGAHMARGDAAAVGAKEAQRAFDPDWPAIERHHIGLARAEQYLGRYRSFGASIDAEVAAELCRCILARSTSSKERWFARVRLGLALQSLGERQPGQRRLDEALRELTLALEEVDRTNDAREWSVTQVIRGDVLHLMGKRELGTKRLLEAVDAFQAALDASDAKRGSLEWAWIQTSACAAFLTLGKITGDVDLFRRAVAGFSDALEAYARDTHPEEWIISQVNLSNALMRLGQAEGNADPLRAAVAALSSALEVRSRQLHPVKWANLQNSLGLALKELGIVEANRGHLEASVAAFKLALEETTSERGVMTWATTRENLAQALVDLARLMPQGEQRQTLLVAAYDAASSAMNVYASNADKYYISNAELTMASIQQELGRF